MAGTDHGAITTWAGRLAADCSKTVWLATVGIVLAAAWPHAVRAHPVPKSSHDRTLVVRLTRDAVLVQYRLEVDAWTAVFEDLRAVEDLTSLSTERDFYGAFTRTSAVLLARPLAATVDGIPLQFACVKHEYQLLDHLRCDFLFQADWRPSPGRAHRFTFHEGNYAGKTGLVKLNIAADPGVRVLEKSEPGEPLQARPALDVTPEELDRLRSAVATVELSTVDESVSPSTGDVGTAPESEMAAPIIGGAGEPDLLRLLLNSKHGVWLLLVLSGGLGAAHALTPGHGKTLVAAYLIGERGTTLHALVLGLVTTLTHTGVVLVLALALRLYFPEGMTGETRRDLQRALELLGGLLIAGLGFWLLLRRLAGQADHVHLGGSGHHHHHHAHHHHAHEHLPNARMTGWWGLIALGISGGIVPCWDAVALLLAAVAMNLLWWALPMLLAFSAGLAGVLILIGIAVVRTKNLLGGRWEESRLYRALPILSAVMVTSMGLWLCYNSAHAAP